LDRLTVAFDMTDAVMAGAIRDWLRELGRDWFRPRNLAVIAASGAISALGATDVMQGGNWLAWIAAIPPVLFVALFVGWAGAFWWLPRAGRRKVAHLPHRRVDVEIADETLAFATATERIEVAWSEVLAIRRLRAYWLFCLRAGAKIPVPAGLLAESLVATLRARLPVK